MNKVEIYTKTMCPYCVRAKSLLKIKGVSFEETNIGSDAKLQQEMIVRSGRHTVPQIFINDIHVGGSDDLIEAAHSGLLDQLLSGKQHASAA